MHPQAAPTPCDPECRKVQMTPQLESRSYFTLSSSSSMFGGATRNHQAVCTKSLLAILIFNVSASITELVVAGLM